MADALQRLLECNATSAPHLVAPPPLMQIRDMWGHKGVKGTVVLSCSVRRGIPEKFLGMDAERRFAVIRNAGGRAMNVMRSLRVLNDITPLGLILVVRHTRQSTSLASGLHCSALDCGTTHVSDNEICENIKKVSSLPAKDIEAMDVGKIKDLEVSIKEDVALIKDGPLFGGHAPAVVGLLYEIETGS